MKIGLLGLAGKPIPTIDGDICAPHTVIANLTRKFKTLGHEVIVFSGKDSRLDAEIISAGSKSVWSEVGPEDKNPIAFSERKVEYDEILSKEAIELYRKGELDIINSHDIRFSPYLFSEAKVPVIYTPHFSLKSRFLSYDSYRYRLMQSSLFGLANISKENIEFAEQQGMKNYGYVPNGVELSQYDFNGENREGLLLVGRMVAGKMVKEAIEIAEKIGQTITLIGPRGNKDEDQPYFDELEKEYLHKPFVKYIGFLNPTEIIPYYQKAKVLLFPSKSEGMPLSILEAMATGLPVAASAVGGIIDVIVDGVDGALVNENSIEEWQSGIERALKITNDLPRKKIEEKFTLDISSQSYIEAYKKFIANAK